ncbi:MAG: hypothetical protein LBU82_00075 [Treponema sp.]|jgi:hypothetical protein|nr:hypothetical protein [Treponema sp.]
MKARMTKIKPIKTPARAFPAFFAAALALALPAALGAIDISASDGARLDIVSRTSFGIDLDNAWRFGLSNELTQLDLVFGLAPYQKITNRLNTPDAVGFIQITLFHLDLIKVNKDAGYHAPSGIGTNRYQTGEFLAGVAKGPWLFQLNAMGNEPFASPWNKTMSFINDGFKFSWAYLDSMVDVRRINSITGVPVITRRGEENMAGDGQTQEHGTMKQFGFDTVGNIADRFGPNIGGQMVAAMYNSDAFGINVKLGTEYSFESANITEDNQNGVAAGVDAVFNPAFLPGLRVFVSAAGTYNYSFDEEPDPVFGGARVGYTMPLNEDISLEPWAGIDFGTRFKDEGGAEKPGYEASVGATMRFPGRGGWLKDYILNSDGRVFPGMSVGYKVYEEKEKDTGLEHSIKFTLFEPRGDEGVFYGLGAEVILDLVDLTGVTKGKAATANDPAGGFSVLFTAYFDYEIRNTGKIPGSFVPWTILYYDNLPETAGDGRYNNIKIDFGVNLENAVANTTFGVVWNTGSLLREVPNQKLGYLRFIAEIRL